MITRVSLLIQPTFSRRSFYCRAAADVKPKQSVPEKNTSPALKSASKPTLKPHIHIIEQSKWEDGIPAIQGAHLMASGTVAPISTSKGVLRKCEHVFEYFSEPYVCSIREYPGQTAAAGALGDMILAAAKSAIETKGVFSLAIAGGSVVNLLKSLIDVDAEFEKWHLFWVDERVVPLNHSDSNFKAASDAFLAKLGIPLTNQHSIVENASAVETATHYEGNLVKSVTDGVFVKSQDGFPVLDFVLLGVGPDGHIASLFPNSVHLSQTSAWVLPVLDSPKPPSQRITLTLPVINNAQEVVVAALGSSKAEIVQRILEVQALPGALPAQLVRPISGKLTWVLDAGSSENLTIQNWEKQQLFPRNTK
eukprot:g4616.t1